MALHFCKKIFTGSHGLVRTATAVTFALLLASCGGSSPTAPTPPTPQPPTPPTTTAPTVTCPGPITTGSPTGTAVPITYPTPTATGGVAPVTVSCTPASGSPFAIGTTAIVCTATAANGQTGACTFQAIVTPPLPRLAKTNFLAYGDSLTLGEVTTPVATATDAQGFPAFKLQIVPTAAYPRQLQLQLSARYTQQTMLVSNGGRSGETANEGAKRFPGILSSSRAEVVLLLEGANDLNALGNAALSSAAAAVESMAKEARFRNTRVFIATLPPAKPGGRNTVPASLIQAYNARLASIASGEGAVLVDLYSAMLPNVNMLVGSDGLHLTEVGYQKVAEIFFDAIRRDLEIRP